MKKLFGLVALTATLLLASCTSVMPLAATSNTLGSKVGEASTTMIFGVIPMSTEADIGIQKAAQNGGISKISTVDQKVKNYVLWSEVTTVVTGD